jgi:catechol 1,2-dioxygenase
MRPAHVHFIVSAPGHKTLVTQIFSDTLENMLDDVVFGAKEQIAGDLRLVEEPHPVVEGLRMPYYVCAYDFRLKEGEPTFPVPPIKGKAARPDVPE